MGKKVSVLDHLLALLAEKDLRNQQRFDSQEVATNAALLAAKEAVIKAETATEKRFESVNEFRKTLSDQAANFIARTEYEQQRQTFDKELKAVLARLDRTEGRSVGLGAWFGYIVGAVGAIGVVVMIVSRLLK